MNETEVQPLLSFVLGMLHIVNLLLARHLRPCRLSPLISDYIVELDKHEQSDIVAAQAQQSLVTADVVRSVILAIDIASDDVAALHKPRSSSAVFLKHRKDNSHIIERRANCSCTHTVAVARVPSHQNRMTVGVRKETSQQSIPNPVASILA
jgi:hypothetical protein